MPRKHVAEVNPDFSRCHFVHQSQLMSKLSNKKKRPNGSQNGRKMTTITVHAHRHKIAVSANEKLLGFVIYGFDGADFKNHPTQEARR